MEYIQSSQKKNERQEQTKIPYHNNTLAVCINTDPGHKMCNQN